MTKFRLAALVVAVAAFAAVARASIEMPPPPHEVAATADAVFVGKVESVGDETMKVAVGEVLKGDVSGTVVVEPIWAPSCFPGRREGDKPLYAVGDRIVVAAKREKETYSLLGGACVRAMKTDEELKHEVAFHKEMLRIVALPDALARRAAMVAHMSSADPSLASAARSFQYREIHSAEDARPHVAGLVAALSAPLAEGRHAAMYALHGLTPPEALERLIELTKSGDGDEAGVACEALAPYDDERAVAAVIARIDAEDKARGAGWGFEHLGLSPRPEARVRLAAALKSDSPWVRKGGFYGFLQRFRRVAATEIDAADVLAALKRGITRDESHTASLAVACARSPKLDAAVVALVHRKDASVGQRAAAYMAFQYAARNLQRADVPELLRKSQTVFIERADAGETEWPLYDLLAIAHTPQCLSALERAATSCPDESARGHAKRTLEAWDKQ